MNFIGTILMHFWTPYSAIPQNVSNNTSPNYTNHLPNVFAPVRFRRFLLYMGMSIPAANETKVNSLCKTVSEFALEYRTSRERHVQQRKRLQEKRERNKTRGKMWIQQSSQDAQQPPASAGQNGAAENGDVEVGSSDSQM